MTITRLAQELEWSSLRRRARILSNGRYAVLLDAAGCGSSSHDGYTLNRWVPDAVCPRHGLFLYLRDLESGRYDSVCHAPVRLTPDEYSVVFGSRIVSYRKERDGIATRLDVCVARDGDAELRRLTLSNTGGRARRLELTSYLEVALNTPAAEAAHPAFSKLFIQTAYDELRDALLAWRRPRSPDDRSLWLAHRIVDGDERRSEYETDRARFIGRGRSLARPAALSCDSPLSGTVGNVLDPVFALRRVVTLAPGEVRELTIVLAAGANRDHVSALIDRFSQATAAVDALDSATPPPPDAAGVLGVPMSWLATMELSPGTAAADELRAVWPVEAGGVAGQRSSYSAMAVPRSRSDHEPGGEPRDASNTGSSEPLRFFNGYGGFTQDGREYVLRIDARDDGLVLPPLPWVNVIANPAAGVIASETGACHSWTANSRENRLTPWSNDPVEDPHGEALYVRDERTRAFWSPTPGPARARGSYEVRHGFGYTRYLLEHAGLHHETVVFVPRRDPLRIVLVRVENRSTEARELSLFSYAQLVLGGLPAQTRSSVSAVPEPTGATIVARNPARGEFSERVAIASAVGPADAECFATADRASFIGEDGSAEQPAAVASGKALEPAAASGGDACAALQCRFTLTPGATATCAFVLGEAESEADARALLAGYATIDDVERARDEAVSAWYALLSRVRVETPSPAIDVMVNGWLAYQNLSCRLWARTAFYQSGGAFGFRDQLQDAAALIYLDPSITRAQILLHAAHQFIAGDVLHWWHPPTGKGIRTRFSDDLLWLPYVVSFYVRTTGDASVLDEEVPFVEARQLEPDEDEAFVVPERSSARATVYEHCCRAIDRSLTAGAHGLPLIGVGDWNDGMNRVGREGSGESVWLGFFLYRLLGEFIPYCSQRGEADRVETYTRYRADLYRALNDAGWDGSWYRRAFYDDGTPLGSAASDECRIDALAQAWSVLSGVAPPERAALALDALEEHLVSVEDRIIRLLTPPFDRTPHDPGYIKGYLPGVRENGGQYTHAALWVVRALAEFGRTERAALLLELLSPVSHTDTPEDVTRYRAEPYVIAADVYGVAPHVGRAGWTWYTGSAGWMYRVALESVLGITLHGDKLGLSPCIPAAWPGFRVELRFPGDETLYRITVERTAERETRAQVEGEPLEPVDGAIVVPLRRDGGVHDVRVVLGLDVAPRYRPSAPSSSEAPFERITSE